MKFVCRFRSPTSCVLKFFRNFSAEPSFNSSHVIRIESSPVQHGDDANYTLFVNYPSDKGPVQLNLLAGIISVNLKSIENETKLNLQVETSVLAPSLPSATPEQASNSIILFASHVNAQEV